MADEGAAGSVGDEIKSYRIHVSKKYLELTKRKLELTRLPHDVAEPNSEDWWEPKPQVEPLIDYWLEQYSWKHQEDCFNDTLPQFRTSIPVPGSDSSIRLHFIHVPSKHTNAVPLLLLPPFPFANLSLGHLIKPLTDPDTSSKDSNDDASATPSSQPFHLVIPSLPGIGFSDALPTNASAIATTAALLDTLMTTRLSYPRYLVSNAGPGASSPGHIDWKLAKQLSSNFPQSCLGAHLIEPVLKAPKAREDPWEWTKWSIARVLGVSAWGYCEEDFDALRRAGGRPGGMANGRIDGKENDNQSRGRGGAMQDHLRGLQQAFSKTSIIKSAPSSEIGPGGAGVCALEPNTLAYALCDSPVGLLVFALRNLRALGSGGAWVQKPEEDDNVTTMTKKKGKKEFTPEELITMAMLAWLPGPEAALRFWASCTAQTESKTQSHANKSGRGGAGGKSRPNVAVTVFLGEEAGKKHQENVETATEGRGEEDGSRPVEAEGDVEMANLASPPPPPNRYACPSWANAKFNVVHAQRVPGLPGLVAWERPEIIVEGATALARNIVGSGGFASNDDTAEGDTKGTEPLTAVVVESAAASEGQNPTQPQEHATQKSGSHKGEANDSQDKPQDSETKDSRNDMEEDLKKQDYLSPDPKKAALVEGGVSPGDQSFSSHLGSKLSLPQGRTELDGASPETIAVSPHEQSVSPLSAGSLPKA